MTSFAGPIRVVGAGLLGTSIGLALTKQGADVIITSQSAKSVELAIQYGAGRAAKAGDAPSLIVVCVPPQLTAKIVAEELHSFPNAVVTDVASVKASVLEELKKLHAPLERYVGSHPMAGRERSGAIAGRADLFIGRPWVISPTNTSEASAIVQIENLAVELGASPIKVTAEEHDRAVALVSHLPQMVASLTAAQLVGAIHEDVALAGQGIRDTIRIAASDPKLWVQILGANSSEVVSILEEYSKDLTQVIDALRDVSKSGALSTIDQAIANGNRGVEQIPGKHGSRNSQFSAHVVMIDDQPGELARLLTEIGEIGINVEDLKLEHSPGAPIGLVELQVLPSVSDKLTKDLTERGWRFA